MYGREGPEWLAIVCFYFLAVAAAVSVVHAAEGDSAAASYDQQQPQSSSFDQQYAQISGFKNPSSYSVVGGMAVMFGRPDWQIGFNQGAPTTSACIQQVQRVASRLGVHVTRSR